MTTLTRPSAVPERPVKVDATGSTSRTGSIRIPSTKREASLLRFSAINLITRASKSKQVRNSIATFSSSWDPNSPWKTVPEYISMIWFHLTLLVFCTPLIPLSWVVIFVQSVASEETARPFEVLMRKTVSWTWFFWVTLNPQIRKIRDPILYTRLEQIRQSKKPVMIVANHISFFDVILFSAYMPSDIIEKTISLCSIGVIRMPLIGNIVNACGHVPVNFTNACVGAKDSSDFTIEKSSAEKASKAASEHVERSGMFVLYPEGKLNASSERVLQQFRHTGFRMMQQFDMSIWGMAMVGNQSVWPAYDFGGLPGKVHVSLFPIFPDGAKGALETIRKNNDEASPKGEDKEKEENHGCEELSTEVRRIFQEELDEIWESIDSKGSTPVFKKSICEMKRLSETKRSSVKKEE